MSPRTLRVPAPEEVQADLRSVRSLAGDVAVGFGWLYTSGYAADRRSTATASNDPASLLDGAPGAIRHHLGVAADHLQQALRKLQVAHGALDRAQALADEHAPAQDDDWREHPELGAADRRRVHRARERRIARMESHATPWAREEVTG